MVTKASEVDALLAKYPGLVRHNGPGCAVGGNTHRELLEALIARGITAAAVSRIAKAEGFPVGPESVRRHARRECKCQ